MENIKFLFIELQVREGERLHTHRVLHTTKCENIDFAAEFYAATYWGYSYHQDGAWWVHGGEIAIELTKVKELTPEEFKTLNKIFT